MNYPPHHHPRTSASTALVRNLQLAVVFLVFACGAVFSSQAQASEFITINVILPGEDRKEITSLSLRGEEFYFYTDNNALSRSSNPAFGVLKRKATTKEILWIKKFRRLSLKTRKITREAAFSSTKPFVEINGELLPRNSKLHKVAVKLLTAHSARLSKWEMVEGFRVSNSKVLRIQDHKVKQNQKLGSLRQLCLKPLTGSACLTEYGFLYFPKAKGPSPSQLTKLRAKSSRRPASYARP